MWFQLNEKNNNSEFGILWSTPLGLIIQIIRQPLSVTLSSTSSAFNFLAISPKVLQLCNSFELLYFAYFRRRRATETCCVTWWQGHSYCWLWRSKVSLLINAFIFKRKRFKSMPLLYRFTFHHQFWQSENKTLI